MGSQSSSNNRRIHGKYFIFVIIYTIIIYVFYRNLQFIEHEHVCDGDQRNTPSFIASMSEVQWLDFKRAVLNNDFKRVSEFSQVLFFKLFEFVKKAPPIVINETCHPPILTFVQNCTQLKKPRRVGILLQFGFDVDALEVHLHELDAVVDKVFIVESTIPHSHFFKKKPLIWDKLKYDERFEKFLSKIVHFVVDDASYYTNGNGSSARENIWELESLQEKLRWDKFLEWNSKTKFFDSQDLLGFGDTDEIPNRNNIFTLKHCELLQEVVDIGIWFPFPYIDTLFRTDFPVTGHPYTLGDPTFWTLAAAMRYSSLLGKHPNRMRGQSSAYLLGGFHMSKYPFPPYQMLKILTASEASFADSLLELIEIGILYSKNETERADARLNIVHPHHKKRIEKISDMNETNEEEVNSIVKFPWFIQCNPDRYPSLWENGSDLRLRG